MKAVEQDIQEIISWLRSEPQKIRIEDGKKVYYYTDRQVLEFERQLLNSHFLDKYQISLELVDRIFRDNQYERSRVDLALKEQVLNRMVEQSVSHLSNPIRVFMKTNDWLDDYQNILKRKILYFNHFLINKQKPINLKLDEERFINIVSSMEILQEQLSQYIKKGNIKYSDHHLESAFKKTLSQMHDAVYDSQYIKVLELRHNRIIRQPNYRYHPTFGSNLIERSFIPRSGDYTDNAIQVLFWINRYKNLIDDYQKEKFHFALQPRILNTFLEAKSTQEKKLCMETYQYLFQADIVEDLKQYQKLTAQTDILRKQKNQLIETLIVLLKWNEGNDRYPYWGVSSGYDNFLHRTAQSFSIVSNQYFEPLTFRINEEMYERYKDVCYYPLKRYSLPQILIRVYPKYIEYLKLVLEKDNVRDPKALFHIYHILGDAQKRESIVPELMEEQEEKVSVEPVEPKSKWLTFTKKKKQ